MGPDAGDRQGHRPPSSRAGFGWPGGRSTLTGRAGREGPIVALDNECLQGHEPMPPRNDARIKHRATANVSNGLTPGIKKFRDGSVTGCRIVLGGPPGVADNASPA